MQICKSTIPVTPRIIGFGLSDFFTELFVSGRVMTLLDWVPMYSICQWVEPTFNTLGQSFEIGKLACGLFKIDTR
jgi:hypothetical protein